MNNSTDNVTLIAAFVNDVINLYDGKPEFQNHLKKMTKDLDLSDPMKHVPMATYNEMCYWIEDQIGQANTKKLGRRIGETAYTNMLAMGLVKENATPTEMMEALQTVAATVIKDPEKRGWEIVESGPKYIIMRRTQTFNRTLQFGLLDELIRKTKVLSPKVEYVKEVSKGDEYDEYKISWF